MTKSVGKYSTDRCSQRGIALEESIKTTMKHTIYGGKELWCTKKSQGIAGIGISEDWLNKENCIGL